LSYTQKIKSVILLFLLLIKCIYSQDKVLKDFDFENHDYRFYIIYNIYDFEYVDSITRSKSFMINDKQKLKRLKNDWIATHKLESYLKCSYDYYVEIFENDSIIGDLTINTECGQVIAHGIGTSYDFTPGENPFEKLIGDAKIYDTILQANTYTKAINLHNLIIKSDSIFYPAASNQKWLNYNGRFDFNIKKKYGLNSLKKSNEIKRDIYASFPNSKIYIDFWSYSKSERNGYIYCDSSFFEKIKKIKPNWSDFNFYIPEYSNWKTWQQYTDKYPFSAYIYATNKCEFDKLIEKVRKKGYLK